MKERHDEMMDQACIGGLPPPLSGPYSNPAARTPQQRAAGKMRIAAFFAGWKMVNEQLAAYTTKIQRVDPSEVPGRLYGNFWFTNLPLGRISA